MAQSNILLMGIARAQGLTVRVGGVDTSLEDTGGRDVEIGAGGGDDAEVEEDSD